MSTFSILFNYPTCPCLYQYHDILVTVSLKYYLKWNNWCFQLCALVREDLLYFYRHKICLRMISLSNVGHNFMKPNKVLLFVCLFFVFSHFQIYLAQYTHFPASFLLLWHNIPGQNILRKRWFVILAQNSRLHAITSR